MKEPDYSDIIDLPPHKSSHYPPMSRLNRAAQFLPFAALTGYEEGKQIIPNIFEPNSLTIFADTFTNKIRCGKIQDERICRSRQN